MKDLTNQQLNRIKNFYNKYGGVWMTIFAFFKLFNIKEERVITYFSIDLGNGLYASQTGGAELFVEIGKPGKDKINYVIDSDGNFLDSKYIAKKLFYLYNDEIENRRKSSEDISRHLDMMLLVNLNTIRMLRYMKYFIDLKYNYKIIFTTSIDFPIKLVGHLPFSYEISNVEDYDEFTYFLPTELSGWGNLSRSK